MKVFKCNVCGVEFYEGHSTCPFCKEPAKNATYVGTKEDRADSTDLFQYAPCDEDVSKCTTSHRPYSHTNTTAPTHYNNNTSSSYNSPPHPTNTQKSSAGIHLILGIISFFWLIIPSIINIIIYKSHDKSGWTDAEAKTAKIGVTFSKVAIGIHVGLMLIYILMTFLFFFFFNI